MIRIEVLFELECVYNLLDARSCMYGRMRMIVTMVVVACAMLVVVVVRLSRFTACKKDNLLKPICLRWLHGDCVLVVVRAVEGTSARQKFFVLTVGFDQQECGHKRYAAMRNLAQFNS